MKYVPIIGLEIHAELETASKLFCRCANTSHELQTAPNTAVCPVCLGLPGALPVINKKAIESTVKLGLSLGSSIPQTSKWDRKNYFYPDLPKSYQISQYDEPLCAGGRLQWFDRTGTAHDIELTRIHLEEDTGKLTHPSGANYSLIDYNRSSIPLLELVTEPVISSAEEAKQFGEEYQLRLRELGVAEASMEKGQMRCEANISIVPEEFAADPSKRLSGTKVEVKNLNSFRSLERAILYEIERQTNVLESGGSLVQETRGWNEAKGETYSMRTKETADDYRYFPDPDLLELDLSWINREQNAPVTPSRYDLFAELHQSGLRPEELFTVINDTRRAAVLREVHDSLDTEARRLLVQWLYQEPALLTHSAEEIGQAMTMLAKKEASPATLKQALASAQPNRLVAELSSVHSSHAAIDLDAIINQVMQDNPAEVERYRQGDTKLFGFFMGQTRKALQGKGDPEAITQKLQEKLK